MQFDMFHVMVVSWLLLTCLACAVLQSRKGFADDGNRFSETDRFPGGYFALVSGLAAVVAGVLIALLRVLAELQVLGSVGASAWFAAAVLGLSIAALLFVLLVVAFYVSFRAAKSRRRAIGVPAGRLRQLHVFALAARCPSLRCGGYRVAETLVPILC